MTRRSTSCWAACIPTITFRWMSTMRKILSRVAPRSNGWVLLALLLAPSAIAQPSEKLKSSLDRIFNSNEFSGGGRGGGRRGGGGTRWIDGGKSYAAIEGGEIIRYDAASGKREVWVSAARLAS